MAIVLVVKGKKESVEKISIHLVEYVQEFCDSKRIEGKYWQYAMPVEEGRSYEICELILEL